MMRLFHLAAVATLALAGLGVGASAQDYPSRPVKLLIGNSPGGPSDISLRVIADILSQSMKQPFVVENRPGGNGTIAGQACAGAAPDGYTLCMADSYNIALNPSIMPDMPYSPTTDLKPIIHTGFLPSGLWAPKSMKANSLQEVLTLAKAQPGKLNFATFGAASSSNLYVDWLKNTKGIEFTKIPYKSAVDAYRAVVAGQMDLAVYALRSGLPQLGKEIKLLAVNTDERMPGLPDVQTFKEGGIENVVITWFGLFAPKGTPDEIVRRLNDEISKGLFKDPAARKRGLEAQGLAIYGPAGGTPEALAALVRSETAMYAGMVKAAKGGQ